MNEQFISGVTLSVLTNIFNVVSLKHKNINQFYTGDSFDIAVNPQTKYPIAFLETPFNISYNDNGRTKDYQFAYFILFKVRSDDNYDSNQKISLAEDIGDAILSKIDQDYKTVLRLRSVRCLTVDEFGDDYLAGVRYEMTGMVNRKYQITECYEDQFDSGC